MFRLDVASDYLFGYVFSNGTNEDPVSPQGPTPEFFTNLRMAFKEFPSGDTLHYLNYLAWAILWWGRGKQVNVIGGYLKSIYLDIVTVCYTFKYIFQGVTYFVIEDQFPVFRYPDEVVLQIVDRMSCSFCWNRLRLWYQIVCLRQTTAFIPAASSGVFSGDFYKLGK